MALTPLLPVRHRQGDFFIADVFDNLPWKDTTASMEHPLFTLSLKPDMRLLKYTSDDGTASIEMQPSMYGLPNIMDKDVLLYCASVVMERINAGETPPQTIRLSLRDVLIATNRHATAIGYKYIKTALNRLTGCMLRTTIKTGRRAQGDGFHLIERYRYLESEKVERRIIGVEVTLSDWFYNSLIAKEVITINKEYFRLRKPLERRLYEIARKHCGYTARPWSIGLSKLHKKSGSTAPLKRLRFNLRELETSDHLPDYSISFNVGKDMVTFQYRGAELEENAQDELLGDLAPPVIPHQIPPDLLEDARHVVGSGLDYYGLWAEFRDWKGSKSADNMRGGFIGFCRTKAVKAMRTG